MAHWLTGCSNALGGGNNQTIYNPSCDHRNSQNDMFHSLWLNINSFMCWRPGYLAAEKTPHQYYVIFQMWVRGLSAKVQKTKSVAYHPTDQPLAARLFEALSGWCPNSRGLGDSAVSKWQKGPSHPQQASIRGQFEVKPIFEQKIILGDPVLLSTIFPHFVRQAWIRPGFSCEVISWWWKR